MKSIVILGSSGWWDGVKDNIGPALINTVVGICVVFLALIFISFVISLFKYISVFEKRMAEKKAAAEQPKQAVEQTAANTAVPEEEPVEEEDDLELVAVITAAIHAYEEAQGNDVAGDLVVRSIRRRNKANWQNA